MSSENKEEKPPDKPKSRKHRVTGFEEWGGYMASKKMKLANQFNGQREIDSEELDEIKSDIFKGISIFVNGYTKPSADELKRLMIIHGGTYHYYYSSTKTTHIVASNLPYSKIKNLKNQIVVKPDWITDSIKAAVLLPYQSYLLYPPEVINKQQRLKLSDFTDSKSTFESASNDFFDNKSYSSLTYNVKNDKPFSVETSKELPKSINVQQSSTNNSSSSSSTVSSLHSKNINSKTSSPSKTDTPVTAGHPDFLSEFYSHSRLHHISTAGQELKRYVQSLVNNKNSKTFAGREHLKTRMKNGSLPELPDDCNIFNECLKKSQPVIMHLDMDCFFVSVGLRNHPELKGKPVAVTHSKGKRNSAQDGSDIHFEASYYKNQSKKKLEGVTSAEKAFSDEEKFVTNEPKEKPKISKSSKEYGSLSEIASCSYEARKAGVRNGMFLGEALRRCPTLKTIPYDFEGYSEVSKEFYDIVASYTLDIEPVSCDELYIDCSEVLKDIGVLPLQFASVLREEIVKKTKCTASAGIGPNMLLARLANKVAKPNGQYYIENEKAADFIARQKVKDLPGVGYSTSAKFEHMGVITCGDLQSWSLSKLQQEFGPKTGQTLYNRCRGKDNRVVQLQKERKSVSAEINYGIRFEKEEDVFKFLKELSVEVVNRLRNINCKGKFITLKLMIRHPDAPVQTAKFMGHGVCDHIAKSVALKSATDDPNVIGQECCSLARSLKIKPEDYRGIGIQMSKLEPVQKDAKGYKSIENFITAGTSKNETESHVNKEIFAPKELTVVNKTLPKGNSVKDFLLDKSSPKKQKTNQLQTVTLQELDQSVLNALPEDLQKEVLEMYSNQTSTKSSSSVQHSSPSTHTTVSTSSKLNKVSFKKGTNICPATKSSKTPTKQNTLYNCLATTKSSFSDDTEESVLRKKASIGGAENINEVRSLVKEWVLSSQVVLDEDIDQFRDYILQVIDEDLKKVDLILKYFHRVVSTANTLWQQAYLTILSYVQQKMLQKYGTMLEAKSDFTT